MHFLIKYAIILKLYPARYQRGGNSHHVYQTIIGDEMAIGAAKRGILEQKLVADNPKNKVERSDKKQKKKGSAAVGNTGRSARSLRRAVHRIANHKG